MQATGRTVWLTGQGCEILIHILLSICTRARSSLGVDDHDHQQHQGGDQGRHGGQYVVTLVGSWVSTINYRREGRGVSFYTLNKLLVIRSISMTDLEIRYKSSLKNIK